MPKILKRSKAAKQYQVSYFEYIMPDEQVLMVFFIPAPYVKLYLVNGKRCIEKAKTMMARKTLDPFYQQLLAFKENCRGCILQVRLQLLLIFFIMRVFLDACMFDYDSIVYRGISGDGVGRLRSDRREKSVHGHCTDRIG